MGIAREKNTFKKMVAIYCHDLHGDLCSECLALLNTLEHALIECPYGDDKPLCSKCPTNCLEEETRLAISNVMRYSGPRMLYRHPALTLLHVLDTMK